ncbi:MAG: choice-of-anchor B family protein, partial [Bacteroidota bacterium]
MPKPSSFDQTLCQEQTFFLSPVNVIFPYMRYFFTLLILFTSSVATLFSQVNPPFGMNFLGNLDYNVGVIDVWGYVGQGNTEYAIVGIRNGVSIVDVTNPTMPNEVQFIPGIFSGWRDMKTFGHYCYVSNESGNGLQIIDLSNLPNSVTHKDTIIQGMSTIHNLWIDDDGFIYLLGSNQFNGGMAILDLKPDPWNPVFVGEYTETYVHDVFVRGDMAYVAEMNQGELAIVDVTDRSNPVKLGEQGWDGAFTHNTWLNDASDVCFTTDELDAAYVYAWDVSDPTNIEFLDRMRSSLSNGEAIPHNVHVLNDFLIISYYRDGVVVVDGSRPQTLVEVGHFDTSPLSGGGFAGAWGAYPFLPSGNILASDMQSGLWVIGPDFQRGCFVTGIVKDSITGNPVNLAEVVLLNPADTANVSNAARYDFGVRDSGTYQIKVSAPDYYTKIVNVTLDNGVVLTQDIELRSIPRFDLNIEVLDAVSGQPIEDAPIWIKGDNVIVNPVELSSDANGLANRPGTFVDNLQVIVGKWGYITEAQLITPSENSTTTYTFTLEQGYEDYFDLDLGWEVNSTAIRGEFERVVPAGGGINGDAFSPDADLNVQADFLNFAYVTQNGPGDALDHDVDSGYVELISPEIDLSIYNKPLLTLQYWFANFNWPAFSPGDDNLTI